MVEVEVLLEAEEGRYTSKLRNIYFKNQGSIYCDAYLVSIEDCNKSIPDYVADYSQRHFQKDLCRSCQDNYR